MRCLSRVLLVFYYSFKEIIILLGSYVSNQLSNLITTNSQTLAYTTPFKPWIACNGHWNCHFYLVGWYDLELVNLEPEERSENVMILFHQNVETIPEFCDWCTGVCNSTKRPCNLLLNTDMDGASLPLLSSEQRKQNTSSFILNTCWVHLGLLQFMISSTHSPLDRELVCMGWGIELWNKNGNPDTAVACMMRLGVVEQMFGCSVPSAGCLITHRCCRSGGIACWSWGRSGCQRWTEAVQWKIESNVKRLIY